VRVWLAMFLGFVGCSGDGETPVESGPTETTTTTPTGTTTAPQAGLFRNGEYELRGTDWTGTEQLRLFEDDLFEPTEVCTISYSVTGTKPVDTCEECNASPEGNGGAHAFVISKPAIDIELYDGACDIVLGAPMIDVGSVEELDGVELLYGWGEEPTNHGYAVYQLDDQGEWFFRTTMGYPWDNPNGILDQRKIDALMTFSLFEGSYAY